MFGVCSVNFGNINSIEKNVPQNGPKPTQSNFDWGKKLETINSIKASLLHNTEKLKDKRTVAAGSIFTANMSQRTTLKAKVEQIFENIKLKFWNVSKSISKDCDKLENLLLEGVTASIHAERSGSLTDVIKDLEDKICEFLRKNPIYPPNTIEPLKSYPPNYNRLSRLKERVEVLHKFSEYADSGGVGELQWDKCDWNGKEWKTGWREIIDNSKIFLKVLGEPHPLRMLFADKIQKSEKEFEEFSRHANTLEKFNAFYKEVSADDVKYYEMQDKKNWHPKQFEALDEAKAFSNELEEGHPLKSFFTKKINEIEERIIGDDQIRDFYDEVDEIDWISKLEEVPQKCSEIIQKLKSMEKWLQAVDPDFKDLSVIESHPKDGRFWRVQKEKSSYAKENVKNNEIKSLLEKRIGNQPGYFVKTYRGIPYIADSSGKPVFFKR